MRVRCRLNSLGAISDAVVRSRLSRSIHLDNSDDSLTVGLEYSVFAIRCDDLGAWLYLDTNHGIGYPVPYPVEFFEPVASAIPPGWLWRLDVSRDCTTMRMGFEEFVDEQDSFYESLVDGDTDARAAYERLRDPARNLFR
jgi:hypothetical protein